MLKRLSHNLLLLSVILCIVGFVIMYVADMLNIAPIVRFSPEILSVAPITPLMMIIILFGVFGESIPLVILGFTLPAILLVGICLLRRNRPMYRIIVYPLLLGAIAVSDFVAVPILPGIIYFVLSTLADVLP